MRLSRRDLIGTLTTATVALWPAGGMAQTYPRQPIRIVVPFPAGGPTDTVARIVAERLQTSLGQPVVIENVTGAGGSLGIARVIRAPNDGYTLSVGNWASHVGMSATYPVQYDVLGDLEPVTLLAAEPQLIVVRKDFPANNLAGLVEWLRSNPDKATEGTAGVGSASHVAGHYFQKETGTRFRFVAYRGSVPVMQDLLAGQIDLSFALGATSIPQVRAGAIKAFAVTSKNRLFAATDVPTVDEAGVPGLYFSVWNAMWAPKDTPPDVLRTVNSAVMEALSDPTVRQRLNAIGQEVPAADQQGQEALRTFHRAEAEKWWPIIKAAGIKSE
jgi:tripartite-type tricarboxylate transporter receptor subunit TctC